MKRSSTTRVAAQGMRVLLLLLALLLMLAGCNEMNPPIETKPTEESSSVEETTEEMTEEETTTEAELYAPLSKEMDWKIRKAYRDAHVTLENYYEAEDLSLRYFGEFNGAYVVFVDGERNYHKDETYECVAGIRISYPTSQHMRVYHEESGTFEGLRRAYWNGWLTFEDLLVIKERYEGFGEMTKEEYRALVYVEPLSDALEQKIKACYIRNSSSDYTLEELSIDYWGEYNGSHVLFMHGPWGYWQALGCEKVEDLIFVYSDSREMRVYNEERDSFSSLKNAYEAGWLTYEDLTLLQNRYVESWGGWEIYQELMELFLVNPY